MNLEDLRLFHAVARSGSFSSAARSLGMPKGTLSRRIAAFETALGVRLIHRTTRRMTLSEGGRRLLQGASPLLEELQALADDVQSLQREPHGPLHLQVPAELLTETLARLLAGFSRAHPAIRVRCSHYVGSAMSDPEDFDLTLLCYESRLPASGWIAVPFLSLRQGVYAAPGVAPERIESLAVLGDLPALLPADEVLWHFRVGGRVEAVSMTAALYLDSAMMRLEAAELGAGLVKAPALLAESAVRAGRLVPLALPHAPVALTAALFYRTRVLPARVRAFVDYLQSNLTGPASVRARNHDGGH